MLISQPHFFHRGVAKWVRLGDLNITSDKDDAKPVTYNIAERITHPQYKASQAYNDIALFKLATKVEFGPYIRPICLYTSANLPDFGVISGWGLAGACMYIILTFF